MSVLTQDALLRRIRSQPNDLACWLAWADWLEERGDPRAVEIRQQVRLRLPFTLNELQRLEAIAAARASANAKQVQLRIDFHRPPSYEVTDSAALAKEVQHLCPQSIAENFPRDDEGRFSAGETVLLTPFASEEFGPANLRSRDRKVWLCASGPPTPEAPQKITVALKPCNGRNHRHRWYSERWLWDRRHGATPQKRRWGLSPAKLPLVRFENRKPRLEQLLAAHREHRPSDADRITLSLLLLDEARFAEAFDVFGIWFRTPVTSVLTALPSLNGAPRAHRFEPSWPAALRRALWEAAPWRLADHFGRFLQISRFQYSPGEARPPLCVRLFALPDQPYRSKFSLVVELESDKDDYRTDENGHRIWLRLEATETQEHVAETHWKRPVDLDIARCVASGT